MAFTSESGKKKQSIFPDFPRGTPTVDKGGNFTPNWHLGFSSLFQGLQRNFTNEGIQLPQLTSTELDSILENYTSVFGQKLGLLPNISGKVVYDSSNNVPRIFVIIFVNNDPSGIVSSASWKTFTIV